MKSPLSLNWHIKRLWLCYLKPPNKHIATELSTCNAVPTTCQQDVFVLFVPSLLTQRLVDNLLYKVVELNRLVTSCSNNSLSFCNSKICQQVVCSYDLYDKRLLLDLETTSPICSLYGFVTIRESFWRTVRSEKKTNLIKQFLRSLRCVDHFTIRTNCTDDCQHLPPSRSVYNFDSIGQSSSKLA